MTSRYNHGSVGCGVRTVDDYPEVLEVVTLPGVVREDTKVTQVLKPTEKTLVSRNPKSAKFLMDS